MRVGVWGWGKGHSKVGEPGVGSGRSEGMPPLWGAQTVGVTAQAQPMCLPLQPHARLGSPEVQVQPDSSSSAMESLAEM
jgi:hypothetical protein